MCPERHLRGSQREASVSDTRVAAPGWQAGRLDLHRELHRPPRLQTPDPRSQESTGKTLLTSQSPPAPTFYFLNEEPRASPTNNLPFVATRTKNTVFFLVVMWGGEGAAQGKSTDVQEKVSHRTGQEQKGVPGSLSPEFGLCSSVVTGYADGCHTAN